ncbi:MAG: hypothetical protein ACRDWI_20445, partial [Jiangellaceae bacterium]
MNGWTPVLPPVALWLPASGGLVAALLGGIAPAIRAGFVDPVEALAIDARQGVEMAVGADQAVPETGGREGELVAEGTDEAAGAPPPEAREDGAAATVPVAALRWVGEFAPVLIVGLVVRYWLISSRVPSWWQDSHDYLAASRHGLGTLALWAGERTVAVPLLLKMVGGDDMGFMEVQVGLAALCWAILAKQVMSLMPASGARWVLGLGVLALSLAAPVTMWDRSVLSESLAFSTLALLVAALLRSLRKTTWASAGFVAGASALWMTTRDTHAWLVLAVTGVALLAAFAGIATRRAARRVVWPLPVWACIAAVSALAVLGILSANHGHRSDFPTRNVYQARVLPYPDRAAWFADHGMPQEDQFVGPYRRPRNVEPGMPPLLLVPEDDPSMAEWNDWVASDGAATFRLWALTHPWYVGTEPLR